MVEFDVHAAPFVLWQGSHEIMREYFATVFTGMPVEQWGEQDTTAIYHAARERVFSDCERVEIHARPGEAFLAHRLVLAGLTGGNEHQK
ncbi:MAG: hypothetical protein GY896_06985 [Gammaproteobacteria bacterium]|nr:hypothetical protein [Gammaproteobacteria bacterium]